MEDVYVLGVDIGGSHIKVPVLFWQLGKKR